MAFLELTITLPWARKQRHRENGCLGDGGLADSKTTMACQLPGLPGKSTSASEQEHYTPFSTHLRNSGWNIVEQAKDACPSSPGAHREAAES